jgi:hypothetical protein
MFKIAYVYLTKNVILEEDSTDGQNKSLYGVTIFHDESVVLLGKDAADLGDDLVAQHAVDERVIKSKLDVRLQTKLVIKSSDP